MEKKHICIALQICLMMPFLVCAKEMNAKSNSYNMQVTVNKDGSMLKFLSPETEVKNDFLPPPKVMIMDATMISTILPKMALVASSNPKMSVDGETKAYQYKNAKTNPKIYNLVQHLHDTDTGVAPLKVFFKKNNTGSTTVGSNAETSEKVSEEKKTLTDIGDADESSGEDEEEEENEGANNFPPKAPEIPIELGNTLVAPSPVEGVNSLQKVVIGTQTKEEKTNIQQQKKKPCVEGNCVQSISNSDGGDEDEAPDDDEERPQPDIPIELGLVKPSSTSKLPLISNDQHVNKAHQDEYRVVDIDEKTPESFIMILPPSTSSTDGSFKQKDGVVKKGRQRRSVLPSNNSHNFTNRVDKKKNPKRSHFHRRRGKHHRRRNHNGGISPMRRFWNAIKGLKRNYINYPKESLHGYSNAPSINGDVMTKKSDKHSTVVDRPVRAYITKLSNDLKNIMGQAKKVLQSTELVTDGLKRVVGGTSVLSDITNNAVKNAKFFEADPGSDSDTEYLHEQSIVALIAAEKASREAEESAIVAKEASTKAIDTVRRMSIAGAQPGERSTVSGDEDKKKVNRAEAVVESLALRSEKAANFARTQTKKVHDISLFLNRTLKRMEISKLNKKINHRPITEPPTTRYLHHSLVTTSRSSSTVDPEYEDFNESSRKSSLVFSSSSNRNKPLGKKMTEVKVLEKKKKIDTKPQQPVHHLVPGEYTGFKRSKIPPSAGQAKPFRRFKSVGKTVSEDASETTFQKDFNYNRQNSSRVEKSNNVVADSITNTAKMIAPGTENKESATSLQTVVTKEKVSPQAVNEQQYLGSSGSASGDGEDTESGESSGDGGNDDESPGDVGEGVDMSKLLAMKTPVTVNVHVSSVKEHTPDETSVKGGGEEVAEDAGLIDPFGFNKIVGRHSKNGEKNQEVYQKKEHHPKLVDPFGFHQFESQQNNKGSTDRKTNDRHARTGDVSGNVDRRDFQHKEQQQQRSEDENLLLDPRSLVRVNEEDSSSHMNMESWD